MDAFGGPIEDADGFYSDGVGLVFLERVRQGPGSLADLEAREAEAAAQQRRQQEATVTLADLEGRELPTLRQAAVTIAVGQRRVEARDGRIVVLIPDELEERDPALDAAKGARRRGRGRARGA